MASRRQVTALCYDLVGSTRLAAALDPEDMQDLQRSFHESCGRAVTQWGGHVHGYAGDGAMVLFGYPSAHEDDPERAVRAALEIVSGCERLNAGLRTRGTEIAVRVGVATGVVVAGDSATERDPGGGDIVGFALNLASKLQSAAAPNTVLVSASTHALTAGLFEHRAAQPFFLNGTGEPHRSWRVLRARRTSTRFQAIRSQPLSPLVSRRREMATIERRWNLAKAGQGQVVLVAGEPGIGKSRLALAAKEAIVGHAHVRIVLQCSPQGTDTAFHPVISELERALAIGPRHPEEVVGRRLRRLLTAATPENEQAVPLVARMLGFPGFGTPDMDALNPDLIKERTIAVLLHLVEGLSGRRPTFIVIEDAHWLDPTSSELLDLLVDRLTGLRVLLLVTARPGFAPAWLGAGHAASLSLRPLARRSCVGMVRRLSGGRPLPSAVVERIIATAEGVPLFIEELTRAVIDTRARGAHGDAFRTAASGEAVDIPATLSDLLTARLDQLGAGGKEIVQVGSAIGRTFPVALVRHVVASDEARIDEALERLGRLGLATVQGRPHHRVCTFRHALIQEAAYQSMLRAKRRSVHRQIVRVLEREWRGTREAAPEILGHHHAEAGEIKDAIEKFHEAGRLAAARSADVEAVRLLGRALELVRSLPSGRERDELELSLIISMGPVLIATSGPGAPEAQRVYERAIALCARLPRSPLQLPAYWGWWRTSPNFKVMHDRADVLSALAENLSDEQLRLQAHHCQWATLCMLGEAEACCEHAAAGLRLYEQGDCRAQGILYGGHDPKGCALGWKAFSLWFLGFPDASLAASEENLAHTARLGHSGSVAHAREQEILLRRYRREAARVLERAHSGREFGREQRFPDLVAKADIFEGWALAVLGDARAGVEMIEQGLATQRAIGTQEDFPVFYEMLAEAYGLAGQPEGGIQLIDEAMEMTKRTGLQYWAAELLRRRGELLLAASGNVTAAIDHFDRAAKVAGAQRARSLQLRAALSKARVLADRGHRHRGAALACLAPVYAAFTEGFDTPDLREAKALLDELTPAALTRALKAGPGDRRR